MELDKFITEALTQILNGVRTANVQITNGMPTNTAPKTFLLKHGGAKDTGTGIEFDLAISVKSEVGGKGRGKVKVLSVLEAEVGGSGSFAKEQVSHIKFMIFVNQWRG